MSESDNSIVDEVHLETVDQIEIIEDVDIDGDDTGEEDEPQRFNVSSYGWDSDVEGLVNRLSRGDVYTPGFQRGFVWTNPEKSRFIESLVLGLPVPTIFLAQDSDSKRLNIVDGQQRLKTLQQYLKGGFALSGKGLQEDLSGCYYSTEVAKSKRSKTLSEADARQLAYSVIHAIVIKPDPTDDDADKGHEYNRAVIQIFRRLNTSGRPLQHQEIRASVFHGSFDDCLRNLNENSDWRSLFGTVHSRMRDVEAILRFIALFEDWQNYRSAMPKFLDNFMEKNRHISEDKVIELEKLFAQACSLVIGARSAEAFKRRGTFVLTLFDAVMVGIATALRSGIELTNEMVSDRWNKLENDNEFIWSTEEFVNDTNRVKKRMERSIEIFQ